MDTPPDTLPPRSQDIFYGWWLVALSGFIMLLAHVPLFHAMGVWAVALEREFGWSRTQLGLALTDWLGQCRKSAGGLIPGAQHCPGD